MFIAEVCPKGYTSFTVKRCAPSVCDSVDAKPEKAEKSEKPEKQEKAEKAAPVQRTREKKLKFTFKEQREFETIDDDIAALEEKIAACQARQGTCGSDYVKLQELMEEQKALETALEEKTERWMYLMELKEKIDAQ